MNYSEENPGDCITVAGATAAAGSPDRVEAVAAENAGKMAEESVPVTADVAVAGEESGKFVDESGQNAPVQIAADPAGAQDYITRSEAEELIERAYLRGKNQAIRAQMIDDSMLSGDGGQAGALADDIAEIFRTRPSVWDNSL